MRKTGAVGVAIHPISLRIGNSVLLETIELGGGLTDSSAVVDPTGLGRNFLTWTPFQGTDQPARPLLHKLLNVPSIRQRYLAHMRTVLNDHFNETDMNEMIDTYASKIDAYIAADPKTFITNFSGGIQSLKNAVATRCTNLWSDAELDTVGPSISEVKWMIGTVEYASPSSFDAIDNVIINATVEDLENGGGIDSVYAYLGQGIEGPFSKAPMYDDGNNEDGIAGDGVYGVSVAEGNAGVRTRFYIEAIAGDTPGTRTYSPSGAEHDTFTYQVDE